MVVNAVQGLHYDEVIIFFLVFFDHLFDRGEVLLVRKIYVIQEWTFTWEETASYLQTFGVPILRFLLFFVLIVTWVFFHLEDKPNLRRIAKISNSQMRNFENEGFPRKFQLIFSFFNEIL